MTSGAEYFLMNFLAKPKIVKITRCSSTTIAVQKGKNSIMFSELRKNLMLTMAKTW